MTRRFVTPDVFTVAGSSLASASIGGAAVAISEGVLL